MSIGREFLEAIQKAQSIDAEMAASRSTLMRLHRALMDPKETNKDPALRKLKRKGLLPVLLDILSEHDIYERRPGLVRARGAETALNYMEVR